MSIQRDPAFADHSPPFAGLIGDPLGKCFGGSSHALDAHLFVAAPNIRVRKRLALDGAEPLPGTPEAYAADIDREETQWSKVVKATGASAQ